MYKTKVGIWTKSSMSYNPGDANSSYCKCLACKDDVIGAVGRMHDHWAKCKKRPRSIGWLNKGFQPSRKSAKSAPVLSSTMHLSADAGSSIRSVPEPQNSSLYSTSGRQHFVMMTKGKMRKLHQLFAPAVHRTAMPFFAFDYQA